MMFAAFSSKTWSSPLRQQDVMIQKATVFLCPPPFENPKPHIERLVASLDMGNTVVPRTYCRVFMILNTGQRHSLIFCGKCASPAGNNVRIICVVWIDQQEYALTFYSLAVYVPRGLRFRNST